MATVKKGHPVNVLYIVQRLAIAVVMFLFVGSIVLATVQAQVPQLPPLVPPQTTATGTPSVTPTVTSTVTFTPTVTRTPAPTKIPCPPLGEPVLIGGETRVIFQETVTDANCDQIQRFVGFAQEKFVSLSIETGPITVYVFASAEAVTPFEYEVIRKAGCNPDSQENILATWKDHGSSGQGTRGAVFLLARPGWARLDMASAIAHEMTQAAMINILGSCQRKWQVPDWYAHGLAEYNAETFTLAWGLTPWPEDLFKCRFRLEQLKPGQECIYMEAQMALHLLKDLSGRDKGMDVIVEMSKGKSFNSAFYDVYGISVSEFSDMFEEYRKAGYKLVPTPTSNPPSGDGG